MSKDPGPSCAPVVSGNVTSHAPELQRTHRLMKNDMKQDDDI